MLKLSPRMKMAADMVRPGCVICDIGTDHAYLPSYLILSGRCPSALACDIGKGPLDNARRSVESLGIADKVTLRLSDGLDEVRPEEADDFVFCGMGGTLMAELISRAEWLKNPAKAIVAQPMSHIEDVRKSFIENGFAIIKEDVCTDAGHIYACINAVYDGKKREAAPGFIYYGLLPLLPAPEAREYVEGRLQRLVKHRKGIDASGSVEEKAQLDLIIKDISEVLGNDFGK